MVGTLIKTNFITINVKIVFSSYWWFQVLIISKCMHGLHACCCCCIRHLCWAWWRCCWNERLEAVLSIVMEITSLIMENQGIVFLNSCGTTLLLGNQITQNKKRICKQKKFYSRFHGQRRCKKVLPLKEKKHAKSPACKELIPNHAMESFI